MAEMEVEVAELTKQTRTFRCERAALKQQGAELQVCDRRLMIGPLPLTLHCEDPPCRLYGYPNTYRQHRCMQATMR